MLLVEKLDRTGETIFRNNTEYKKFYSTSTKQYIDIEDIEKFEPEIGMIHASERAYSLKITLKNQHILYVKNYDGLEETIIRHQKQKQEHTATLTEIKELLDRIVDILDYSPPSEALPRGGLKYQAGKKNFDKNNLFLA